MAPAGLPPILLLAPHGYAVTFGQALALAALWGLLCAAPALILLRHLRRVGNSIPEWWVGLTLFAGPLGLIAYWSDRKRNARLERRRIERERETGRAP